MIARPKVLDLYVLPWVWLLWVCISYGVFAGPLPSTVPYPRLPTSVGWCHIQPALSHWLRLSQPGTAPGTLSSV